MNVGQLRSILKGFNEDMEVIIPSENIRLKIDSVFLTEGREAVILVPDGEYEE